MMKIKELYQDNEEITIESYLEKFGISNIQEYINPTGKYLDNPMAYTNMREAVQLMKYHILQGDSMYIIQDADFDGIASTYELFDYLHILADKLGIELDIKVLIHDNKECGLNDEKIFNYIKENPRPLLIIPDAGTNEVKETRELFDMGIDILVIDHHDILTPIDCGVLVNNQVGEVDKQGSGGVLTHQFLRSLDLEFNVKLSSKYVDIVALSIVSDCMDITSMQNRTYLKFGLFSPNCIKNEFLQALIDEFVYGQLTIKDLAWSIVPKFNAIVRCGDNEIKKELFLAILGMLDTKDAVKLCEDAHNNQRKNVSDFISKNKDMMVTDDNLVVISSKDLLPSYSGLIGGKVCEQTHKPCIVGKIRDGIFIGSLRSPIGLAKQINETGLAKAKGHPKACGFFIKEENIPKLVDFINTLDINVQDDIEVVKSFYTSQIPNTLFNEFEEYETLFGTKELPKPIFHIKGIKVKSKDIIVMKEKHLKFKYKDVEFLYFNTTKAQREEIFSHKDMELEVTGELSTNTWRNKTTNQVKIEQIEIKEIGGVF